QAEDGIRDFHVTGVQTCALPIYSSQTCCACNTAARTSASERTPKKSAYSSAASAFICCWTLLSTLTLRSQVGELGSARRNEYCMPLAGSPYRRSPIRNS